MSKLSNDIIFEILSRIPGSALMGLRCVCKEWCLMIADSGFVKTQCQRQIQNTNNHRLFCIFCPLSIQGRGRPRFPVNKIVYSVRSSATGSEELRHHCDLPENYTHNYVPLMASCDGLVCYKFGGEVYLCNPITKKFRGICDVQGIELLGLGFDGLRDDYKVVKMVKKEGVKKIVTSVYSLKSDCWKRVGGRNDSSWIDYTAPISLNGCPHWMDQRRNRIVLFDFSVEGFRWIGLGKGMKNSKIVGLLNGCISVKVEGNRDGRKDGVWVMEEYGVAESWRKVYETERLGRVLAYTVNGKVLVERKKEWTQTAWGMYFYDPTTQTHTVLEEPVHMFSCWVLPFVETLISP